MLPTTVAVLLSSFHPGHTFGLHSFEAISVCHGDLRVFIMSSRSDSVVERQTITVSVDQLKLFQMDWEQIDRILFEPEPRSDTLKPSTFALSSLNLVL